MKEITKYYCSRCDAEIINIEDVEDSRVEIKLHCFIPNEYGKSLDIKRDMCPSCRIEFSKDIDKVKEYLIKWM